MDRLTLFQVVEVTPVLARGFSAYVVAIDGPQVALMPLGDNDLDFLPENQGDVVVVFKHVGHVVALNGSLHHRGQRDDARFQVSDGIFVRPQRSTRLTVTTPVMLIPLGADGKPDDDPIPLQTIDVGPDGVTLEPGVDLTAGARMSVELMLPGEDSPVTSDAVLRRRQGGMLEAQFDEISQEERSRIRTYVYAQLRGQLKRIHGKEELEHVW
jgi:hypothetical protein